MRFTSPRISILRFLQTSLISVCLLSPALYGQNPPRDTSGLPPPPKAEDMAFNDWLGNTEVPLESWIYPAFERMAAFGLTPSAFSGLRPWTRAECLRLLDEAREGIEFRGITEGEPLRLYQELRRAFAADAERAARNKAHVEVETVYTRALHVAGKPLTDGFHFGQTVSYDYGRPLQQGFNNVTGFSARGGYKRWTFYARGEFQHSPGAPPLSDVTRQLIARMDDRPADPAAPFAEVNRFRWLDLYAAFNVRHWQVSAGKQSGWWSPAESGAFMLSNNAEPFPAIRIARVSPIRMPGLLRFMGPLRTEFFIGQLDGHRYGRTFAQLFTPPLSRQPLIHGQKFSFKPTENLEFGFSATTLFGGVGYPLNLRTFFRSFGISNALPGAPNDPGDRRSGFDMKYRVPGLRNWLTVYVDTLVEDEFSPVAYLDRSVINPGIYLPQVPGIPKLDFRAEGFYSDVPDLHLPGVLYENQRFLSGYTNEGNIMGHTVGRWGSGFRVATRYWFSGPSNVQASYRSTQIGSDFLPLGGNTDEVLLSATHEFRPDLGVRAALQFQRWNLPAIEPGPRRNVSTAIEITFHPKLSRAQ